MNEEVPLTKQQRLLMAYIDDELDPAERAGFEQQIAEDSELALETVKFQNLIQLSRATALAEPTDHEMRRFWARFYNRSEWSIGWVLFLFGAALLLGDGLFLVLTTSAIGWVMKAAIMCVVLGGSLLLWNTARLKARTSHFDRYRGVMR